MKIFFSKKFNQQLNRRFFERLHDHIEFNYLIIIVLVMLFGFFVFSLSNFVMIFRLRQEWKDLQINLPSVSDDSAIRYYDEPINKVTVPDANNLQVMSSSSEVAVAPVSSAETIGSNEPSGIVTGSVNNPVVINNPAPVNNRGNWKYNVFGDGFSNSYYVDMSKTNFRYDENATAFSFKPVYEKRENGPCSLTNCGFSTAVNNQTNNQTRLAWDGNKLNFDGAEVKEFSSYFSSATPQNVSIYQVGNYWLVGAVWNENGQERGRAWRFDGKKMSLLDPENRVPFITRQGYNGSEIYFGGDANNYIVIYAGYDLAGYQIVDNTLWNITDFFNTRLADRGFVPQIIKHQQGAETVWYICSLTPDKPKLIKMWQNGSKIIRGLISLGDEVFDNNTSAAICREGTDGNLEIAVGKKNADKTAYYQWSFIDKGFDQSLNYQAVSANLSSSLGNMKMANFSGLSLCGADSCGSAALCDGLNFSISNNGVDFQTVTIGQEYLFSTTGPNLLWRLKAFSDTTKNYYSPWFGSINSVYYAWEE